MIRSYKSFYTFFFSLWERKMGFGALLGAWTHDFRLNDIWVIRATLANKRFECSDFGLRTRLAPIALSLYTNKPASRGLRGVFDSVSKSFLIILKYQNNSSFLQMVILTTLGEDYQFSLSKENMTRVRNSQSEPTGEIWVEKWLPS